MKVTEKMFREGYYLEVIKAKYSAATAVITVKEKTVDIKSKKITTNKWLTLEDWASLYEILEKALVQNSQKTRSTEKRKFTRHLEIIYTFEAPENPSDRTALPTIRVSVLPVKKKSRHKSSALTKESKTDIKENKTKSDLFDADIYSAEMLPMDFKTDIKVEEYIPDTPNRDKRRSLTDEKDDNGEANMTTIGYVPSRKSTLEYLQQSNNSSECYVPFVMSEDGGKGNGAMDGLYVPNSIPKSDNLCETYEPSSLMVSGTEAGGDIYIPNSKGLKKKVDEYQPDFIVRNKSMKFDDSYVPSSSQRIKELKKNDRKLSANSGRKSCKSRENEKAIAKEGSSASNKKNSNLGSQSGIKREM